METRQIHKGWPGLRALIAAHRVCWLRSVWLLACAIVSLTLSSLALAQEEEAASRILAVRFGDHVTKLRFVMEMSEAADFEILYGDEPTAILIDFPRLVSDVPLQGGGLGFIEGYALDETEVGGSRVSLTLSRPARAGQVFYLPETPEDPPRFVLDIAQTTNSDFASLVEVSREAEPFVEEEPVEEVAEEAPEEEVLDPVAEIIQTASLVAPDVTSVPDDLVEEEAAEEPAEGEVPVLDEVAVTAIAPEEPPAPLEEPEPATFPLIPVEPDAPALPVVVLDPGHGGYDPGAVSESGVLEKDITIEAALILRDLLLETGRYDVRLTRTTDTFMALRDRVAFARDAGATMFLSLHADSIGDPNVRGASVYTLSDVASDREAAALAARENRVDLLSGVALDDEDDPMTVSILIDLAQRQSRAYSTQLANLLIGNLQTVQPLVGNTHRQAGFAVLTAPDVPSVLLELGYLSSSADVAMLRDRAQLRRLMIAVERAVEGYLKSRDEG